MKIGILSMQRVPNYGSFFQSLALKKILEDRGHEVRFVDIYENPHIKNEKYKKNLSRLKKIKKIDKYLFRRIKDSQKNKQLDEMFRDSQRKCLKLEEGFMDSDGCDAVVVGSDEIFNCSSKSKWGITGQRFGNIPGVNFVVSYAASCGYTDGSDLADVEKNIITTALKKMTRISVRDKNTANFVKQMIGEAPVEHLDPVLIYDLENLIILRNADENLPKEPYMVVYAYHDRINSKEEIQAIKRFARNHHLRTIAIGGSLPWCDEFVVLSPFRVLEYFRNAECVITDTFHGTIFSVKARKPFAVIVRDSNANKLNDLLERIGIMNHKVSDLSMLDSILLQQDDLEECYAIIEGEKKRSYEYLESVGL